MTGRLASKVVVVTGGGTGIGRAVAGRATAEGAAVASCVLRHGGQPFWRRRHLPATSRHPP